MAENLGAPPAASRISVIGNTGSGKSTLARRLAEAIGAPHLELDSVFHQPGWQPLPIEEFRRRVADFCGGERWVVCGNYSAVQDLVWQRADTVIWLNLPRATVMRQVIRRTVRRVTRGEELWNGNRESWVNLLSRDPERSVIAWAWSNHHTYRHRYTLAMTDKANSHLRFVVVRRRGDLEELLANVRAGRAQDPPRRREDQRRNSR